MSSSSGMLIKIDTSQNVLDWGENPLREEVSGIAFDGKDLWVLDNPNKRICMIEKTKSGEELARRF